MRDPAPYLHHILVDVRIVWGVVEIELPALKAKIQKALDRITGS